MVEEVGQGVGCSCSRVEEAGDFLGVVCVRTGVEGAGEEDFIVGGAAD